MHVCREVLDRIKVNRGDLLEVCIPDSSYEDWKHAVAAIASSKAESSIVGPNGKIPVQIFPRIFSEDFQLDYLMTVKLGRQVLTTRFYSEDLVDFQATVDRVENLEDLNDLCGFMEVIQKATGKRTILIAESIDPYGVKPYVVLPG